jgi:hypothetical protein
VDRRIMQGLQVDEALDKAERRAEGTGLPRRRRR